jgi:hypothetical protein
MARDLRNPRVIDLHPTDIDGAVGVLADCPKSASLDVDHKNQQPAGT